LKLQIGEGMMQKEENVFKLTEEGKYFADRVSSFLFI